MAATVIQAFEEFLKNSVNLDPLSTSTARRSRDWLIEQTKYFQTRDKAFPQLYPDINLNFGSFARRTKIRPLDDIDLMLGLHADHAYYIDKNDSTEIYVTEKTELLRNFCFDGTQRLNSRKIINAFIGAFNNIPQYESAEIKRNLEAAVLRLSSYTWLYDIVPCFYTVADSSGRNYYLIPNGQGDWKKTDPRMDRDRVTRINHECNGNVLNIIRTIKYWNARPTIPSMGSYLIENMVLNLYENNVYAPSKYVDLELPRLFAFIKQSIFSPVMDPKRIQGDINNLSSEDRIKIYVRASLDEIKALEARELEETNKFKESIGKWKEIFGSSFPSFG